MRVHTLLRQGGVSVRFTGAHRVPSAPALSRMTSNDFPVSSIDDPLRIRAKYFRAGDEAVLIKAVAFGPFPAGTFAEEGMAHLKQIRDHLGANAIRLNEVPSLEFMHHCAGVGLRVFIAIPREFTVELFRDRSAMEKADEVFLETILRFRGHPALAGYFVGCGIDATLVRWVGPDRVIEELERIIDLGHAHHSGGLFAYANSPDTENILPQNQDFVAFDFSPDSKDSVAPTLAKLQNLAEDRPLLLSAAGVDSRIHGEEGQAELLRICLEESAAAGVAGMILSAWSDFTRVDGKADEGRDVGLTRRDLTEKPAFSVVRESWAALQRPSDFLDLIETPKVSVIVCTHRGSATLVACLDSMVALDYPDFEIIVVNDGEDVRVAEITGTYDSVTHLPVEHAGLGAARNAGAAAASGDIFVYTDDDCSAGPGWLKWVVRLFSDAAVGCAGGPNIAPRPESATRAIITAAPGSPVQVLLTQTRAEYLPGCNLAVRRKVFEELGGFNAVFTGAGSAVDFCWRARSAGYELGFHPAAFVWHRRRLTYQSYLSQQIGHGLAEARLMEAHRDRFKGLSGAIWDGQLYAARPRGGIITDYGRYGSGPFRVQYSAHESELSEVSLHALWWVALIGFAIASAFVPVFLVPAVLMLAGTLRSALLQAGRAAIEPEFDTTLSRFTLAALIVARGVLRSGARLFGGWKTVNWKGSLRFFGRTAYGRAASGWWKLGDEMEFRSRDGVGRGALLQALLGSFEGSRDDQSGKTDIILKTGRFWSWAVLTLDEEHPEMVTKTRLRLLARPQWVTRMVVLPILLLTPLILILSFGLGRELIALLVFYALIWAAAKTFMWVKRPQFTRIADAIGLEPV